MHAFSGVLSAKLSLMKNRRKFLVYLIGALCIVIVAISLVTKQTKMRSSYSSLDMDSARWQEEFASPYENAVLDHSVWVREPISVALKAAGYPNIDGLTPESIGFYNINLSEVIVVVRTGRLMDDSIKERELLIDLYQDGDIWRVIWAGQRQRCYRSLSPFWTTKPCP